MHEIEDLFGDIVIFELPASEYLDAFRDRLRPAWGGWAEEDGPVWLFAADLATGGDLAVLLRAAQELLDELGLEAIRFCLDGRVYVLESVRTASTYQQLVEAQGA